MEGRKIIINKDQARRKIVAHGGLTGKAPFGKGIASVCRALGRIGYAQIDTISIVNRAHHHILWSRVPDYQIPFINKLQKDQKLIFEYWTHAAAYLPIEDYRFSLPLKDYFRSGKDRWPKSNIKLMTKVLQRIKSDGPLMARDFKRDDAKIGDGWWDWKPAKLALERLFFQGDLMVLERKGFQKVYDLAENVLPDQISTARPTEKEFAAHLVCKALGLHGIATMSEITYLRKGVRKNVELVLEELIEEGAVMPLQVSQLKDEQYYAFPSFLETAHRVTKQLKILSPFDPLVIQRKRLQALFDYEYKIECYVPKPKRRYGYYCLPLLYGAEFVGRLDAKADRKTRTLNLINLMLEPKTNFKSIDSAKWITAIEDFARFNDCEDIQVHATEPLGLKKIFRTKWEVPSNG